MQDIQHRHDISDNLWEKLKPHLPGRIGTVGRNADDNKLFINAVSWILRTGAPWRDLPQVMVIGKILIEDFVDGEIAAYGKDYLRL
jgi:transposase